jgi:hypothetical protein
VGGLCGEFRCWFIDEPPLRQRICLGVKPLRPDAAMHSPWQTVACLYDCLLGGVFTSGVLR